MNYSSIAHIVPSIDRYVNNRIPAGGFLQAVLSNDLKEACARADNQNRYLLFEIVGYLYNEIPASCWGSPERVENWLTPDVKPDPAGSRDIDEWRHEAAEQQRLK